MYSLISIALLGWDAGDLSSLCFCHYLALAEYVLEARGWAGSQLGVGALQDQRCGAVYALVTAKCCALCAVEP